MTGLSLPLDRVRDRRPQPSTVLAAAACVLGPLLVFAVVTERNGQYLHKAIEAGVAVGIVSVAARRPAVALGFMVVFIPLQQVILAYILREHAPVAIVHALGAVKDVVVLGVALAAIRQWSTHRQPLDPLDWFLLAYVALAVLYLIVPRIATGGAAQQGLSVRLLAWRTDAEFAVLLFSLRRVHISSAGRRRVESCALGAATVVAGAGVWEYFAPSAFNTFLARTLQIPRYQVLVLGSDVTHANTLEYHGTVAGAAIVRIGSVLIDPTVLGFYLLIGLALALRRLSEERSRGAWLLVLLIGATIVLTLTRSAVLSAAVVIVVVALQTSTRYSPGRVRVALVLTVIALVAIPLSSATNLTARSESAFAGTDSSTQGHSTDLSRGLQQIVHHPLGAGLGTVAGIGDRFSVSDKITSEDAYVQVGDELGVLTLVAFGGFLVAAIVRLRPYARLPGARGREAAAALGLTAAFLVGGFFQEIWLDFSTSLTAATIIALALPRTEVQEDQPVDR